MNEQSPPRGPRVVVATTAMLTFISFWHAAAVVLNDLGSSAYYVPGIAEEAFGRSAPWFILAVMLFSYTVRMVYIESSSMFVRSASSSPAGEMYFCSVKPTRSVWSGVFL